MASKSKTGYKDKLVGTLKQVAGTVFDEPELVRKGKNQTTYGSRVVINEGPATVSPVTHYNENVPDQRHSHCTHLQSAIGSCCHQTAAPVAPSLTNRHQGVHGTGPHTGLETRGATGSHTEVGAQPAQESVFANPVSSPVTDATVVASVPENDLERKRSRKWF